ncbi:hypothetical protein HMSSN139_03480 [Paenibacillus sp. HMSSN-139]|nr:hypothetical protein HMSSN139_03480 [Paenibacillus sp. HMSSN-139]
MSQLQGEVISPGVPSSNMGSYEEAYKNFQWEDVEKQFSWYVTGKVNMAYEAIDRHVDAGKGERVALRFSDPAREESYTYEDMQGLTNRFANVLRKYGITKGDRVFVFMPRTPELYVSVLGTLKVGAVVGPLFEAFMETAVKDRLEDSGAVALVTTPALLPRVKREELPTLRTIIVVGDEVAAGDGIVDFKAEMEAASPEAEIEWVNREDGLILHYTSGSTGKPKGVYHVHNAMIQHYHTGNVVLDLKEGDVYWCTADPGWVTGTSYGILPRGCTA